MTTIRAAKSSTRWGWGIAGLYIGFVLFMLGLVGVAVMQHVDLVAPDYYAQGQAYQTEIDETRRTAELPERPSLSYDQRTREARIVVPNSLRSALTSGTLSFYRPSMSQADFKISITVDENGIATISDPRLRSGFWRARLEWMQEDLSYRTNYEIMVTK